MSALIVIGFMGVGKTVVSCRLAEQLALPFYDLDAIFSEENQLSIVDYFATYGEERFREKESDLLARYSDQTCVLATGGGIVMAEKNRQILVQNKFVVWLRAPFEEMYQQMERDKKNQRPLFLNKSKEDLEKLYEERKNLYQTCATLCIETRSKSIAQICQEILRERDK